MSPREVSRMFCPNCGADFSMRTQKSAPSAEYRIKNPPAPVGMNKGPRVEGEEIKSTGIAAIASFIIPGLGQIYCGAIGRGIMILIGFIIACLMILIVIGIIIAPIVWVWNIYDAYTMAKKINAGEITI